MILVETTNKTKYTHGYGSKFDLFLLTLTVNLKVN